MSYILDDFILFEAKNNIPVSDNGKDIVLKALPNATPEEINKFGIAIDKIISLLKKYKMEPLDSVFVDVITKEKIEILKVIGLFKNEFLNKNKIYTDPNYNFPFHEIKTWENIQDEVLKFNQYVKAYNLIRQCLIKGGANMEHLYSPAAVDLAVYVIYALDIKDKTKLMNIFKHTAKSAETPEEYITIIKRHLKSIEKSTSFDEYIHEIKRLGGTVAYSDSKYLVVNTHNIPNLVYKFSTDRWCIYRNRSYYRNYTKNNSLLYLTFSVLDDNTDNNKLSGTIINTDNTISDSYDLADHTNKDYINSLPEEVRNVFVNDLGSMSDVDKINKYGKFIGYDCVTLFNYKTLPNDVKANIKNNYIPNAIYDVWSGTVTKDFFDETKNSLYNFIDKSIISKTIMTDKIIPLLNKFSFYSEKITTYDSIISTNINNIPEIKDKFINEIIDSDELETFNKKYVSILNVLGTDIDLVNIVLKKFDNIYIISYKK